MVKIRINKQANLRYKSGKGVTEILDIVHIENAVNDCHSIIDLVLKDIPVDIFSILGMRNLSAFVGELFARSLERVGGGIFKLNPHQDGYPDLLLMNKQGKLDWDALQKRGALREKHHLALF